MKNFGVDLDQECLFPVFTKSGIYQGHLKPGLSYSKPLRLASVPDGDYSNFSPELESKLGLISRLAHWRKVRILLR